MRDSSRVPVAGVADAGYSRTNFVGHKVRQHMPSAFHCLSSTFHCLMPVPFNTCLTQDETDLERIDQVAEHGLLAAAFGTPTVSSQSRLLLVWCVGGRGRVCWAWACVLGVG